ncbi:MAG: HEAT repeat domain-containing protein [Tepidisphaerales bacterium]
MKRTLLQWALIATVAGWTSGATAQPATRPATQPSAAQIEPLIKQLGDENFRARQEARDKLVDIGDAAKPFLNKLLAETKDPEVRSRAESALREISRRSPTEPTLVSLHLKNAPMNLALGELSQQIGADINTWPPGNFGGAQKTVTVDADRQPFWEVARTLCAQSGWGPERYGAGRGALTFSPNGGNWGKRPAIMQGQFMVMAANVQRHETLDFGDPNNPSRQYSLYVQLLADPKMRIVRANSNIEVSRAVDEKGNSLVVKQDGFMGYNSGNQNPWFWELQAPLQLRPDIGKKLVDFKGIARLTAQTKTERWEFDNPLKVKNEQKKLQNDTVTLTIKSVNANNNGVEVQIGISIKSKLNLNIFGRAEQPNPMTDYSLLQQNIKLVDAKGRSYQQMGGGGGGGSTNWDYSFNFGPHDINGQALGEPAKLVWELPIEMKEIPVPVEFKDLPLP